VGRNRRLLAKLAAKENVTLLCHCAETAEKCHQFALQKLIERECGAKARAPQSRVKT
jgi:uncharacterized protein YeaO (DUF488 family)